MTTTVVCKRTHRYDVYCGRPGLFGSPIVLYERCPECGGAHADRGSTLPCFEAYFKRRLTNDPTFAAAVEGLRGKVLGCWCRKPPCHAQVIATYLNSTT